MAYYHVKGFAILPSTVQKYLAVPCSKKYISFFPTNSNVQVRKSFRALQAGIQSNLLENLHSQVPENLMDIKEDQFPLFLTASEWLVNLDSTLPDSFLGHNRLQRGDLDPWLGKKGGFENFQTLDELERLVPYTHVDDKRHETRKKSRRLCDYTTFLHMWPKITSGNKAASKLSPSAVYTEIFSFIKGSVWRLVMEEENYSIFISKVF